MALEGDGLWAVTVMWVLTGVVLVFVVLRIYTRAVVVKCYGIDDHVYVFAFALLVLFTTFIHISATYGFGVSLLDIHDQQAASNAVFFELISQTFAMLGMAIAKVSLGLFLLRLVKETWHAVAIWTAMIILLGASVSTIFCTWFQCSPPAYFWDRTIKGGKCTLDQLPSSLLLGVACVVVDFFFAFFPWTFMWSLQINRREKFVILGSMSLGVLAGACGIKRSTKIPDLAQCDYTKDTVHLIVWSAAEMAVTMVCIGIPICRPLYKKYLEKWTSRSDTKYKQKTPGEFAMNTVGGGTLPSVCVPRSAHVNVPSTATTVEHGDERRNLKLSLAGPSSSSCAIGGRIMSDNNSREEILGDSFRRSLERTWDEEAQEKGILVIAEYKVTTSRRDS